MKAFSSSSVPRVDAAPAAAASSSSPSPSPAPDLAAAAPPLAWNPAKSDALNTTLASAQKKRARITTWIKTAISKAEAEARGMVPISRLTMIRNWTCREALYDHACQATQSRPELVIVSPGRAALYGIPAQRG